MLTNSYGGAATVILNSGAHSCRQDIGIWKISEDIESYIFSLETRARKYRPDLRSSIKEELADTEAVKKM